MESSIDLRQPLLLQPFNAVDLARTPWAGTQIYELLHPNAVGTRVGESWEFSCDSKYPSYLKGSSVSIANLIATHPQDMLSAELVARHGQYCQILVKLINAARPLSFQVHPDITHAKPYDGKWESWLVLAAEQDSKAYIGFARPTSHEQVLEKITAQQDLQPLLGELPLRKFDYVDIAPHTPHALGAGAVILEIQYLLRGEGGKTLRIWDWGSERPLDTLAALQVIAPHQQCGREYIDKKLTTGKQWENKYYRTKLITFAPQSEFTLDVEHYGIVFCMEGQLTINSTPVQGYQPIFLPAAIAKPVQVQTSSAGYLVCIVPC